MLNEQQKTEEELFLERKKVIAYSYHLLNTLRDTAMDFEKVALISTKPNGDSVVITDYKDISNEFESILVLAEEQIKNPIKYDLIMENYNKSLDSINNLQNIFNDELAKLTEAKFGMSNSSYKEISENLLRKTQDFLALQKIINVMLPYVNVEEMNPDDFNTIKSYLDTTK